MNTPIGIIDSGVGGLSIASVLIKNLPNESFIYLADSKNCPYGDRTQGEIYKLTKKMVDFLVQNKIKLLVIACNTITVSGIDRLRKDFPKLPIVGIVPVIKTAVKESKNKKIGIFSTQATTKSNYQRELINKFARNCQVINIGSSGLVTLIENLIFEDIDRVLKKELQEFKKNNIDVLALGCSHFPLIKKQIQKYLPGVLILDSSDAVCRQVQRILKNNNLLSNSKIPSYNFYTTGDMKSLEFYIQKLTKRGKIERISL
ncbi:MAG: glutamate racemase [Candidatus Levybacteria bacterium CG10_big_fil_rev_8_21_14_0_10_35_13]|nr:MAG: glutamate racemase [Candidatus Levybacteria bacterium CG10_big_fil_rev_8_21_14_0_10_35_13]